MNPIFITDDFCVCNSDFLNNRCEGFELGYGICSLYPVNDFNGIFIFITGYIFNIYDLKDKFQIKKSKTQEIIAQLYHIVGDKVAYYLEGAYSIVIVDKAKVLMF